MDLGKRDTNPKALRLSESARGIFNCFREEIESRLKEGDLAEMQDWGSKLSGAVIRIAGGLHFCQHEGGIVSDEIRRDTIEKAIELGRYFLAHSRQAFFEMGADKIEHQAKKILSWIDRKREMEEFNRGHVQQNVRGFGSANEIDPALTRLEERGYIRKESPSPGCRVPVYKINPEIRLKCLKRLKTRPKLDTLDKLDGIQESKTAPEPPSHPMPDPENHAVEVDEYNI